MTPQSPTAVATLEEINLMAVEICLHRGEYPNAVDRGGVEGWEIYKPLAADVLDYAERLIALRSPFPRIVELEARIAELEDLVERVNERALDDISDLTMRAETAEAALSTAEARALERAAKIADSRANWDESDRFITPAGQSLNIERNRLARDIAETIRAHSRGHSHG